MEASDRRPSYEELLAENIRLRAEIAELRRRAGIDPAREASSPAPNNKGKVTRLSSPDEKIALFMRLFAGRSDVYARRWVSRKSGRSGYSPVCGNEWIPGVCERPKVKCAVCPNRHLLPLSKDAIYRHLLGHSPNGDDVVGVYPMLADETCRSIAADFDDAEWRDDVRAFRAVCRENGIDVHVERSRSGNGAHAWAFFAEPISCATARRLFTGLLTAAMDRRSGIKFSSYDRLIPNQDTMPAGGFGNLIALPLQGLARRNGNSEFVDDDLIAYHDQWAYLSAIEPIPIDVAERAADMFCAHGELGVLADDQTDDAQQRPWERLSAPVPLSSSDFRGTVEIVRANGLYVPKAVCSERAIGRIKRLSAFKNPDFFKAQAMHISTAQKPRVICTAEDIDGFIRLPRGLEASLMELVESSGARAVVTDETNAGKGIDVEFLGELRPAQLDAARDMLAHDCGVLSAMTAFGKTITAAYIIASRRVNTLVLVHTQALMTQWRESLERTLGVRADEDAHETPTRRGRPRRRSAIGLFGGGKDAATGVIDVAIVASLTDGAETRDLVRDYGMVIADECHHAASSRYEAVLRETTAKYVYGLTATPIRQDGHHPIIFQQCGPIRHRVDARSQALARGFVHVLIPRFTQFRKPITAPERWHITDIYKTLAENRLRNELITRDAASALSDGRTPLVLTERVDHAHRLAEMIGREVEDARVFVLTGQGTSREKAAALAELRSVGSDEKLIVVATGRYIGEGFDAPRLDTLMIAMPFAWKGTAAQYAGRLHRLYEGKSEVAIFDYVDAHVPALERMYHKRLSAYSSLGYSIRPMPQEERIGSIFTGADRMAAFASDIERASKEILIASPRLAVSTINALREKILTARTNGAVVTVIVRAFDKISALIRSLQDMGARVIEREDLTKRYAVIDRRIVWYGGIDLLGRARADESVMRLENEEIALELSSMT